jgi:hypothetical protein
VLESGGDIDRVAVNIVLREEDVALVDADPKPHPRGLRDVLLPFRHAPLNRHTTGYRVDHTRELAKHAITRQLYEATSMFGE